MISRRFAIAVFGVSVSGVSLLGVSACGASGAETARTAYDGASATGPADTQAAEGSAASDSADAVPAAKKVKPLAGKVVVIDPGHNGGNYRHPAMINRQVDILTKRKACDTTGTATNSGYSEAAFTWDVSLRLVEILKAKGARVQLTRADDDSWGPCIDERAKIGNRAKADAALSIHADGAPASAHGFHVIIPKKIGGPVDKVVGASERLGVRIRDAFHTGTGLPYSTYIGKKALDYRDDLGGLNLSSVPKVMLECGNMRNAYEAGKFKSSAFRQRIADSLAKGLQTYLTS